MLFLADILPTAYEVGVLNGRVTPGDTVAIVGAGPIGLATIMTAKLHTPSKIIAIDLADTRLAKALEFGADEIINNGERRRGREGDGADRTVSVPTWRSRRSECRRPSSSAPS